MLREKVVCPLSLQFEFRRNVSFKLEKESPLVLLGRDTDLLDMTVHCTVTKVQCI